MDIISPLQRVGYLLTATLVSYNNSLHSYWNEESSSCCDGDNCTSPCNTLLTYCFRNYGTENFTDDQGYITGCLDPPLSSRELEEPTDYIDYSMPPLTVANITTLSVLTLLNSTAAWPVS